MKITPEAHDHRLMIQLGLTTDDVEERRSCLGASDANIILSGNPERVHQLWRVKRGMEPPEDLSDVLAVQMGIWTEEFNLLWYQKQTGNVVSGRRSKVQHPEADFIRATLDGHTLLADGSKVIVEAKHVGPFHYSIENTINNYAPQIAVQMACVDCHQAHLSVFSGSSKWELGKIERDPLYEAAVMSALRSFWRHVQDGTEPVTLPALRGAVPVALLRTVDMSKRNSWIASEEDYLATETQARKFEEAKAALKSHMLDDIGEIKGRLLKAKRDKGGSVRISRV